MMLRTLSRSVTAANRAGHAWSRHSSSATPGSSSSGGGGGKVILGVGVATASVIGGTVAYAGVDKDFRKTIEGNVPGSSSVLSAVLGELEPEKKPVKKAPLPAKLPLTSTPVSISAPPSKMRQQSSMEEAKPKSEGKNDASLALPPPPPIEAPSSAEEAKKEVSKDVPAKPGDTAKGASAATKPDPLSSKPVASESPVEKSPAEPAKEESSAKDDGRPSSEESFLHEKDLHRRLVVLREELEKEMRSQLKRQAQAHADHVSDALDVQKRELLRKHARELDEAVEQTVLAQRRELAGLVGHVKGLQLALQHRAEMDMSALEAQELWLACSALQRSLEDSESVASGKRSVTAELFSLRGVLEKRSDGYVSAILDSLPKAASSEGVITESSVRERFLKIERLARRTALIGEEGGSMMRYLLSYVQSFFVLRPSTEDIPSKNESLDLDSLNTFDIVWLARASLDRGDLEQAVRYMTLLRGEPRRVASQWLDDTRVLLELKQACRALVAHAAAVGVEALPERPAKQPS